MTAREKLAIEYPEQLDDVEPGGCIGCPNDYGYLPVFEFCTNNDDRHGDLFERCKKCWDREIPEETKEEKENCMSECCKETMCTTCIHQDICSVKEKFLDAQKAVDGLVVYNKRPDGKLGEVKLRDIGFIKPVELACIHYIYKGSTGVKGGFHA